MGKSRNGLKFICLVTVTYFVFVATADFDARAQDERRKLGYSTFNVPGDGKTSLQVTVSSGETASVSGQGNGDTDLDLYVYDEDGNVVTKDEDYTDSKVLPNV